MYFHLPTPGQSTAEHILSTYRADKKFTHEEARLLDLCLLVHADHGGGNCSTFTCRVLSSSGTDTYAAISAAIGALKGPKHGGANLKAMRQLDYILHRRCKTRRTTARCASCCAASCAGRPATAAG